MILRPHFRRSNNDQLGAGIESRPWRRVAGPTVALLLSMAPPQLLDEKPESAERARSRLSRVASHVLPAGLATSAKHAATAAADGGLLPSTEVCDDDSEPIQMSERECFMFDLHGFLIVREFLTPGEYTFCCLLCVAA